MGIQTATQAMTNEGPQLSFRNRLINGDFKIWQRGTTATYNTTTTRGFVADRWYAEGYPLNLTYSKSTISYENISYNSALLSSITGSWNFFQSVENGYLVLKGKTVTFSFVASGSGTLNIQTWIGTLGAQTKGSVSLTGTPTKYSLSFVVPTNGSDSDFYIGFSGSGGSLNVSLLQLEVGNVATPFEDRPYGLELQMCQRYYEKSYIIEDVPGSTNGNGAIIAPQITTTNYWNNGLPRWMVEKRTTPTVTIYNSNFATVNSLYNTDSGANVTINSLTSVSSKGFVYFYSTNAVSAGQRMAYQYVASAEL